MANLFHLSPEPNTYQRSKRPVPLHQHDSSYAHRMSEIVIALHQKGYVLDFTQDEQQQYFCVQHNQKLPCQHITIEEEYHQLNNAGMPVHVYGICCMDNGLKGILIESHTLSNNMAS